MSRHGYLILVGVALAAGCGSGPRTMRVWGQVSFDGKPIEDGLIVFTPIDNTPGPSTGGPIKNGAYDLSANIGPYASRTYKVEITALAPNGKTLPNIFEANGPPLRLSDQIIPYAYNRHSILKVTIAGNADENKFDFSLDSQ